VVLNLFSGVAVLACKRLIIVFVTFRGLFKIPCSAYSLNNSCATADFVVTSRCK